MSAKPTICLIALFSALVMLPEVGYGAELNWILGQVGPEFWTIYPTVPTTKDVIHFSGPTGVHSNDCFGVVAGGGEPTLTTTLLDASVELWFRPPAPQGCYEIWRPVCGLSGWFGPLQEGSWVFSSDSPIAHFQIPFDVAPELAIDGDGNRDGKVDGADLAVWQQNYDPSGLGLNIFASGDWSSDSKVDGTDLAIWQQNYDPLGLGAAGADGVVVPEPSTVLMLALGGGMLVFHRRRA